MDILSPFTNRSYPSPEPTLSTQKNHHLPNSFQTNPPKIFFPYPSQLSIGYLSQLISTHVPSRLPWLQHLPNAPTDKTILYIKISLTPTSLITNLMYLQNWCHASSAILFISSTAQIMSPSTGGKNNNKNGNRITSFKKYILRK